MSRTAARILLGVGIAALLIPILGIAAAVVVIAVAPAREASANPFEGRGLYVDPESEAALATTAARDAGAEADAKTFGRIAEQPTGIWLVPERNPLGEAGRYAADVAERARDLQQSAVFVLYGVPDRDCGNESKGGLSEREYPIWVEEIGDALVGSHAVIILEPDSLALADQCGNTDRRIAQISSAREILVDRGLAVYLDGGHSNWLPAARMADLLNRAGVAQAHGFATNVSNYNATAREIAYAEQVRSLTDGAHYVIDVGRNGNGSNGDWCNPPGRALGQAPKILSGADGHDADLWIKNPGESDGTCNGGPAAGEWWDKSARELSRNAGW